MRSGPLACVLNRPRPSSARPVLLFRICTTSSSSSWCDSPQLWGECLVEVPHTRAYLNSLARDLCSWSHRCSTAVPPRSALSTTGSEKSGLCPFFFVNTRTRPIMSHSISRRVSRLRSWVQEMGMLLGSRAMASTSSRLHTSILLYTYRHFTYRRLPSITSMRSSTVLSSLNSRSALWILYSCIMRPIIFSSRLVRGAVELIPTPPVFFRLKKMLGGSLLSRMPTDSSSRVRISLCPVGFDASSTISSRSADLHTAMTCRPRPLPCAAPSMIPGRSSSWILASL
mmetsp:Transcript_6252/g.17957  ORF Transcript_6252/g.17957 Transcript_6252/m.17957 type:complete len:284 (-) Transcript_6252:679-1530(-)